MLNETRKTNYRKLYFKYFKNANNFRIIILTKWQLLNEGALHIFLFKIIIICKQFIEKKEKIVRKHVDIYNTATEIQKLNLIANKTFNNRLSFIIKVLERS